MARDEYRAGLSTADNLAAVEQLSLLGLSAGQIVKRTKASKTEVEHALSANVSALARGTAERYEFLTLDQAAAVAEFFLMWTRRVSRQVAGSGVVLAQCA